MDDTTNVRNESEFGGGIDAASYAYESDNQLKKRIWKEVAGKRKRTEVENIVRGKVM